MRLPFQIFGFTILPEVVSCGNDPMEINTSNFSQLTRSRLSGDTLCNFKYTYEKNNYIVLIILKPLVHGYLISQKNVE